MSPILTGDSQKLSFLILTKEPILIFLSDSDKFCPRPLAEVSQYVGWWAEVAHRWGVSYNDKIYIFEILMKNCSKSITQPN